MKKSISWIFVAAVVCVLAIISSAQVGSAEDKGEALFKQNCAVCHPDGGNIINPQKTLHKKDFEKNNIKSPDDVVKTMRNPGPGMTKFDANTIPDAQAKEIAQYIFKTYK